MRAEVPATDWNETTGRKEESQGRNRVHCWGPELGTKEDKIKACWVGRMGLRGSISSTCHSGLGWPRWHQVPRNCIMTIAVMSSFVLCWGSPLLRGKKKWLSFPHHPPKLIFMSPTSFSLSLIAYQLPFYRWGNRGPKVFYDSQNLNIT